MVEELKTKGWVFTYIGANQNVEKVAATISVTNVMSLKVLHVVPIECLQKKVPVVCSFFDKLEEKL